MTSLIELFAEDGSFKLQCINSIHVKLIQERITGEFFVQFDKVIPNFLWN